MRIFETITGYLKWNRGIGINRDSTIPLLQSCVYLIMEEKFKGKYKTTSLRLQNYDYSSNGAYFITICTQNREYFFGKVVGKKMKLNAVGQLAKKYWLQIPDQFSFFELDVFVVMPDHFHGILIINRPVVREKPFGEEKSFGEENPFGEEKPVESRLIATPQPQDLQPQDLQPQNPQPQQNQKGGITGNKNPMLHENLSRVIRWYKGRCSYEIRKINPNFGWQSKFYDHIIRNKYSFERIRKYIIDNPGKWVG